MTADVTADFDQMVDGFEDAPVAEEQPVPAPAPEPPEPSITGVTVNEMVGSLTGFEEIGIAKRFDEMSKLRGTMAARALIFVHFNRAGASADDAYQQAMELPQSGIDGYFEVDDEITPDAPTTESGKERSPDGEQPTN